MLSKEVFKKAIVDLIDFYPSWGLKVDNSTVMAKWYSQFTGVTDAAFLKGVNHHIRNEKFNPTVSTLLDSISKFSNINDSHVRGQRKAEITEDDY